MTVLQNIFSITINPGSLNISTCTNKQAETLYFSLILSKIYRNQNSFQIIIFPHNPQKQIINCYCYFILQFEELPIQNSSYS